MTVRADVIIVFHLAVALVYCSNRATAFSGPQLVNRTELFSNVDERQRSNRFYQSNTGPYAKLFHQGAKNLRQTCGIADGYDSGRWPRRALKNAVAEDERIFGGFPAQAGQWPWVVSLTFDGYAECGATLVSDRFLVTAAHCFRKRPDASRWSANIASLDFLRPNEPGELHIRLAGYQIHPEYGLRSRDDFDVALAELTTSVTFSSNIQPICLSDSQARPGELCTVAGWGLTLNTAPYNLLNQVSVPIVPASRCNSSAFPDLAGRITDSMFCAGYPQGGHDACAGDSGGPIMCQRGPAWYQFGVVSWGSGCGSPNTPGVYARTDGSVKRWIESIVGQPL